MSRIQAVIVLAWLVAMALTFTGCCTDDQPDPTTSSKCEPGPVATPCDAPYDLGPGWCITTPTYINGVDGEQATCNPKCGDRGDCPAGWQPLIINAVCVCGEI